MAETAKVDVAVHYRIVDGTNKQQPKKPLPWLLLDCCVADASYLPLGITACPLALSGPPEGRKNK